MNRRLLLLTIAVWAAAAPLNAQVRLAVTFLDSTPATVGPASDYTIALTLSPSAVDRSTQYCMRWCSREAWVSAVQLQAS
jgi:hypothetical protein